MKELKYINRFFNKYKYRLLLGILISIASRYLAVNIPSVIKNSVNTAHDYATGVVSDIDAVKQELFYNILIILGLAVLAGFFTFLMRQTIIVTSRLIEFDLKNEIYQQYQRLSLSFYKQNRTGDLMNRISEDVGKVRMYCGPAIMYTMNMLVLFSVALFKMTQINLELTLYTLIPFPILSLSIFLLSRSINIRSTRVQEQLSVLTTQAQEFFSGMNIIKSYALEDKITEKFIAEAEKNKEKNISLYKVQAFFFPMMILLIGISNLIVLYIGGKLYIDGVIKIGVIAEFVMYVNMLTWPVAIVGWVTSIVQQAEASQKRINEFLQQEPEIQSPEEGLSITIKGRIDFKDVNFTYPDTGIQAMKGVNFTIQPGERIALLGKTGSGKTTVIDLLTRMYDVNSGSILIDEHNIKSIDLDNLRHQQGVVPQDPFLFSDTIENNIKFGKADASFDEIVEAAKLADVHKNIIGFKEQYKTLLGERGVTLSGGQKQRASIARALIKKPQLYLFDDCLSAVDTETEETILNNLYKVSENKTSIFVSHRVSAAQHADKILVFDEGRLIQQGNHDSLVSQEGYYKELYQKQLLEKND